eukprot:comp15567_c0_seq1/m.12642 comp15567_c0_seq1/g.12642  ORF comp15567_c0_seq1/g.12642 comp15567_c0_seq1/m.12642 type:complete len:103 (-) comp15567_c0_seq1:10-318(-)
MQPGLVGTGGAGLTGSQVLVTYASEEDAATAQRFLNRSLHGTHRITVAYAQVGSAAGWPLSGVVGERTEETEQSTLCSRAQDPYALTSVEPVGLVFLAGVVA